MPPRSVMRSAVLSPIAEHRFYGVSPPFETESANSFLQRLSAQYSLSFPALKRALGIEWGIDPDCSLTPEAFGRMARVCGLAPTRFSLMRTAFAAIAAKPGLADLMRSLPIALPHYRFCAGCWSSDSVPYLRMEWRLQHWTVCPVHRRRLVDRCARCDQEWSHETALLTRPGGLAYTLSNCPRCGHDQRRNPLRGGRPPADELEAEIGTGRAVMAALCSGFFVVSDRRGRERHEIELLPGWLNSRAAHLTISFRPETVSLVRDYTTRVSVERRLARERCGDFTSGVPARTIADTIEFPLSGLMDGTTRASREQNPIHPLDANFSRKDRSVRPRPPTPLGQREDPGGTLD